MKDEYLPIALELEIPEERLATSCTTRGSEGRVLESSISCTFRLFGPGDNEKRDRFVKVYGNGCKDGLSNSSIWHDDRNTLFKDFSGPNADALFVKNPRLTDSVRLDYNSILNKYNQRPLGEYKLSLHEVNYSVCE